MAGQPGTQTGEVGVEPLEEGPWGGRATGKGMGRTGTSLEAKELGVRRGREGQEVRVGRGGVCGAELLAGGPLSLRRLS